MSRLKELIECLCPDGVERIPLGDFSFESRSRNKQRKCANAYSITQCGLMPTDKFFKKAKVTSEDTSGYKLVEPGYFVYSPSRIDVGSISYSHASETVIVSPINIIFGVDNSVILNEYLLHYFQSTVGKWAIERSIEGIPGTGRKKLPYATMAKLLIPVPPIEVQREIVCILDAMQELDDVLSDELNARNKQLARLLRFLDLDEAGKPSKALKDACKIGRGTYITKKEVTPGNIPVVMGGLEPAYYHSESNHNGEAIVISRSGANAGFSSFWNQPIFVSDGFVADGNGEDVLKYVYYALHARQREVDKLRRGSGVPHVNGQMLGDLHIYVPERDAQVDWVDKLDSLELLIASIDEELQARRKQFEYYRDKLLDFPEKVA